MITCKPISLPPPLSLSLSLSLASFFPFLPSSNLLNSLPIPPFLSSTCAETLLNPEYKEFWKFFYRYQQFQVRQSLKGMCMCIYKFHVRNRHFHHKQKIHAHCIALIIKCDVTTMGHILGPMVASSGLPGNPTPKDAILHSRTSFSPLLIHPGLVSLCPGIQCRVTL